VEEGAEGGEIGQGSGQHTRVSITFGANKNGFNFLTLSARERHTALNSPLMSEMTVSGKER
jgi:hypothetical protein